MTRCGAIYKLALLPAFWTNDFPGKINFIFQNKINQIDWIGVFFYERKRVSRSFFSSDREAYGLGVFMPSMIFGAFMPIEA